jgi:hypothetical protein
VTAELNLRQLAGPGCTLDEGGHAHQRARVLRLRSHVERVEADGEVLRIVFDPGVDRALVDAFVATEGACCGFLSLGYDERARVLQIRSDDEQSWDVVRGFGAVFSRSTA